MEMGSNLQILEDENTDTDTTRDSDTGYTAKPKKGRPKRVIRRPRQKRRT
jgi:hypothetical protein